MSLLSIHDYSFYKYVETKTYFISLFEIKVNFQ